MIYNYYVFYLLVVKCSQNLNQSVIPGYNLQPIENNSELNQSEVNRLNNLLIENTRQRNQQQQEIRSLTEMNQHLKKMNEALNGDNQFFREQIEAFLNENHDKLKSEVESIIKSCKNLNTDKPEVDKSEAFQKDKILNLSQQNQQKRDIIMNLYNEKSKLNSQIIDLMQELQNEKSKNVNLKKNNNLNLLANVSDDEREERKVDDSLNEIRELTAANNELMDQHTKLVAAQQEFRRSKDEEIKSLNKIINELNKNIDDVTLQNAKLCAENVQLKPISHVQHDEIVIQPIKELEFQNKTFSNKIEELRNENLTLLKEAVEAKKRLADIEAQLQNNMQNESMQQINEKEKNNLETINNLTQKNNNLNQQNKQLNITNLKLQDQLHQLQQQLNQQDQQDPDDKNNNINKELQELRDRNKSLLKELEDMLKEQSDDAAKYVKNEKLSEENIKLHAENLYLKQQLEQKNSIQQYDNNSLLNDQINKLTTENQNLQKIIKDAQQDKAHTSNEYKQHVDNFEVRISKLTSENTQLDNQNKQLQRQLMLQQATHQELQELRDNNRKLTQENEMHKNQINELKHNIQSSNNLLDNKNLNINQLSKSTISKSTVYKHVSISIIFSIVLTFVATKYNIIVL